MKRTAVLLAALIMLAGCSSQGSSSVSETVSDTGTTTTAAVTAAPETTTTEAVTTSAPEIVRPPVDADPAPLEQQENLLLPEFEAVREQYESGLEDLTRRLERRTGSKQLPCISIYTQDQQTILSKDEYVASVIDVFNCDEQYKLNASAGVKVRGNSTADQGDEKPYRIKFEEKQGMLGLHGGKKYRSWVLLRSYWNFAPDYMGFSLAEAIFDGKYYSSDKTYVDLFINGSSKGVYLLCEQNQAVDGRVEVYEPSEEETQAEIGYFIEMDNYPSEEHPYFYLDHFNNEEITDISGVTKKFVSHAYSIKSRINTVGQFDFIKNYLEGVFTILYEGAEKGNAMMFDEDWKVVPADGVYSTPYEAVSTVIDTESLADMLILEELVQNYDVGAGSFYMAVDFSEESKFPKLTFLAPWDFNWAYSEKVNGGYYASTFQKLMDEWDRSNVWFITAMKSEDFREAVKERFRTLYDSGVLYSTTAQVLKDCAQAGKDLPSSESWKADQVKNIVSFVNGRIEWLKGQWY